MEPGGDMTAFEPERDFLNRDKNKDRKSDNKSERKSLTESLGLQCKTDKSKKTEEQIALQEDAELKAGTGFMQSLCDAIKSFELEGYRENLICCFDHLKSQCRKITILPSEIDVKDIYRFENSSDPSDQSILYAISVPSKNMKGLYIESYGIYHDDQSDLLRKALRLFR